MSLLLLVACTAVHSTLDRPDTRAVLAHPSHAQTEKRPAITVVGVEQVDADMQTVWTTLHDMDRWHTWAPSIDVSTTHAGRPLRGGDRFHFEPDGFAVDATVLDAEPGRLLRFHGRVDGKLYGVWTFHLEPADGGTRVVLREDFSAWYLRLVAWSGTFGIRDGIDQTLAGLKAVVESR